MKIKRNKKSYRWFLCGLILVVVLTISYRVSKANYRISNSIELTTGKVVSSPYDFNIVAIYVKENDTYRELDKNEIMPSTKYIINEEESYCCKGSGCSKENKDTNVILKTVSGLHTFSGMSKGDKCKIYFDRIGNTMEELLINYYTDKRVRTSENRDFNVPYVETTTKTIFSAPDDDGTSYYFAGNPTDNWVEFGGYYWRIIRINGDGSIRMIYQGRAYDEDGKKLEPQAIGEETRIGTSAFNINGNDSAYVGYMYGTPNSSAYELTHENKNDSTIKQSIDNWFNNSSLKQEEYFNKIDKNAGFCGDRQPSTINNLIDGNGGIKKVRTYYGAYIRLLPGGDNTNLTITPTFSCSNNNDLYTYKQSNKGNIKLLNPIGLIAVDEAAYAGLIHGNIDIITFLYSGFTYYTMSPSEYGSGASVFGVNYKGSFGHNGQGDLVNGIRPVINLRSDVIFTGNGTQSNPYKVVD